MVSTSRSKFKLIDFGSATLRFDCHNSYVQSRWYRAPEVMLGLPWDERIDIWSFGCVLAELVLGRPIFYGSSVEQVLAAQSAVLGQVPERLMRGSGLAKVYFTPERELFTLDPTGLPKGVYILQPLRTSLRELLACEDPSFLDFLEHLLQFDPDRRPFAAAALQHPWLQQHLESESKDDEERARPKALFTTKIGGYTSSPLPSTPGSSQPSRPGSSQPSRPNSPDLDASRDPSPTKQPRDSSPLSREVRTSHGNSVRSSSVGRQARRQSVHQHDGPGVPEEFRNSLQCEGTRSSGSEWRQRIARMLTTSSQGSMQKSGSCKKVAQSVAEHGSPTTEDQLHLGSGQPGMAPHRPKKRL